MVGAGSLAHNRRDFIAEKCGSGQSKFKHLPIVMKHKSYLQSTI